MSDKTKGYLISAGIALGVMILARMIGGTSTPLVGSIARMATGQAAPAGTTS